MRFFPLVSVLLVLCLTGCRKESARLSLPEPPPAKPGALLTLKLVSFNVRYENTGEKRPERLWPSRMPAVLRALRALDPDVFGVQEALHGQCADLWASLPDYDFHGVGRDDGQRTGEYAGIFFKRGRFAVDESDRGTFWLSATPEKAGSMTWGNAFPRIAGWVRLIDRANGRGFYVFNTHWDHQNQYSREKGALLIAQRIDARKHRDEAVVLLGDFNATEGNPAVAYLRGVKTTLAGKPAAWAGGLVDAFGALHPKEPARTTLHFWTNTRQGTAKVDHILVSPPCRVKAADISSRERVPVSDHFPVWAEVEL